VLVRTTGATLDDNGYTLRVGSSDVVLAVQDSMDLRDLPPGPTPLALADVAVNCRILSLPSSATIVVSQRTRVVVEMSCDSALRNVILFDRYLERQEIWMMRPDGSEKALFLPNASGPSLTPDGTRVVYEASGRLSVIRVDKTRILEAVPGLRGGQYQPDVSPDGRSLVFTSSTGPVWQLYRANLDGTEIQELTAADQVAMYPRWSPDGRFIVFTRSSSDQSDPQVVVIAADGTNPVALTAPGEGCCARWSPDGTRLLFRHLRSGSPFWTVAPDGTDARRLEVFGDLADWSPDGASLLVEVNRDAGVDLYHAALDGSDFSLLASGGYNRLGRWYR
jgi:Tol biopolymer transport system component